MIPYSDPSEPDKRFPYVNVALIVINFLVFFYEIYLAHTGGINSFVNGYSTVPCEYTRHCSPAHFGAPNPFFITLVTSMFMHGGWIHILGNMIYLWVFGDNVENSMGHIRYLIFYLLCGLGANALDIAFSVNSHIPGLGASGAIAGVLGAYLMLYPRSRIGTLIPLVFFLIPARIPAWVAIGFWFILQLLSGVAAVTSRAGEASGGIAYWAHVGGFATGAILIWLFRHPERVHRLRVHHAEPYRYRT